MSKRQVFVGSAVISLLISAILGIASPFIADEISAKTGFIIFLICLPVFFVIFIPALNAANRMHRENTDIVEIIKHTLQRINAVQNYKELIPLQTELAKSLINSRDAVSDLLLNDILSVLHKRTSDFAVNNASNEPAVNIRNEYMAKWIADKMLSLKSVIVEKHTTRVSYHKSKLEFTVKVDSGVILSFGRGAYAFGGYHFMMQVMKNIKENHKDKITFGSISNKIDLVWSEIEVWKENRI